MKILNFKMTQKESIDAYLTQLNSEHKFITEFTLRQLLKTINVGFTVIGMNRLQSTLMMELDDSYVQQSQRYVPISVDNTWVNELHLDNDISEEAISLISRSIDLYNRMTELKDNTIKGRPKTSDFKYGIPYEDARYILPLAMPTNVTVSMSGDKLVDLYSLMIREYLIFDPLVTKLYEHIPTIVVKYILRLFDSIYFIRYDKLNDVVLNNYYKLDNLTIHDPVQVYDYDDSSHDIAIASLTSTSKKSPTDVYNSWDDEDKTRSSNDLIDRVLGYGHFGVAEHSRSTFGMICSLSCYHQVLRHRIQSIYREPLRNIIEDRNIMNNRVYLPNSIARSEFYGEYLAIIDDYNKLLKRKIERREHYSDKILFMLLNCHMVKFIVSSNDRNDCWIYRERLCLTAQEEIRMLYDKKREHAVKYSHVIDKYGVPPCVTEGKCKEGKLYCGHMDDMKQMYKKGE